MHDGSSETSTGASTGLTIEDANGLSTNDMKVLDGDNLMQTITDSEQMLVYL